MSLRVSVCIRMSAQALRALTRWGAINNLLLLLLLLALRIVRIKVQRQAGMPVNPQTQATRRVGLVG